MSLIELQGATASNKGAHLMVLACLARLGAGPDAPHRAAYYPRISPERVGPPDLPLPQILPERPTQRSARGLLVKGKEMALGSMLGATLKRRYALVERRECQALFDISGYAYGDPWPRSEDRVIVAESYKRRAKPVIFLPQMFGPFEQPASRKLFRRISQAASIVFARDDVSLELAQKYAAVPERIHRAPDLTIGLAAETPGLAQRGGLVVVPNEKVLAKAGGEWGDRYVSTLATLVKKFADRGVPVQILIHETRGGDKRVAEQIVEASGVSNVAVVEEEDPLVLKHLIAASRLVVGSRFHAIVSAFSTGTPAIALGWAHKYTELHKDFGVPELQHTGRDPDGALFEKCETLLDDRVWQKTHETLVQRGDVMRGQLDALWRTVLATL